MRLNQFIARATGMSRRAADAAIATRRVKVNQYFGRLGQEVHTNDQVTLDGQTVTLLPKEITIMLNKPVGYVCSRNGQGSQTIYDLLPPEFQGLKPVGRLDKDSSGLLLLTTDGKLAYELTHPSFQKEKVYEVELDKPLAKIDQIKMEQGIQLDDGLSKLQLAGKIRSWKVTMHEGRNRQIRRTFETLDYKVTKLHRTQFGQFTLNGLTSGKFDLKKI